MCKEDAKSLYKFLGKLLKHFSKSPKSSKLLHQALKALEMNDIHLLNWASTRTARFLDVCIKASSILVQYMDTIFSGNIRPDKTKYIAVPKGLDL